MPRDWQRSPQLPNSNVHPCAGQGKGFVRTQNQPLRSPSASSWRSPQPALAYRLFMRRDFTDIAYDGAGRRALVQAVLPLAVLFILSVGVIAGLTAGVAELASSSSGGALRRTP